jgi:hypothetical protein
MSEQPEIARLEADLRAKEQELARLRTLLLSEGAAPLAMNPPQPISNPALEEQIRRAEAALNEARGRYDDALNA